MLLVTRRTMVEVLLFLGGLAILLVSSRQMFLMFRDGSFRARGQSADRTQRTPRNLLDEFRWSRAYRRRWCRVDLLAIAYLRPPRTLSCFNQF
jgi:hypothetical protein